MAHWTSQYFGNLYHEIYSRHLLDPQRALDEAAFAAHVLDLGRRTVLDLACGYGRHARLLASSNRVYAMDRNIDYVARVKDDLVERLQDKIMPVCGDMRSIPLKEKSVDAAIMLFNSFGYFDAGAETAPVTAAERGAGGQVWKLPNVFYERQLVEKSFGRFSDRVAEENGQRKQSSSHPETSAPQSVENLQVLQEVLRVLKPGGGFLLEVPNPRPLLEAVQDNPRRLMVMEDCEVHEEFEWNSSCRRLLNRTRFLANDREEAATYSLRLYEPAELKALLKQAGFIVRRMYGDYTGDRFRPAASDVLLLHVTRPAR